MATALVADADLRILYADAAFVANLHSDKDVGLVTIYSVLAESGQFHHHKTLSAQELEDGFLPNVSGRALARRQKNAPTMDISELLVSPSAYRTPTTALQRAIFVHKMTLLGTDTWSSPSGRWVHLAHTILLYQETASKENLVIMMRAATVCGQAYKCENYLKELLSAFVHREDPREISDYLSLLALEIGTGNERAIRDWLARDKLFQPAVDSLTAFSNAAAQLPNLLSVEEAESAHDAIDRLQGIAHADFVVNADVLRHLDGAGDPAIHRFVEQHKGGDLEDFARTQLGGGFFGTSKRQITYREFSDFRRVWDIMLTEQYNGERKAEEHFIDARNAHRQTGKQMVDRDKTYRNRFGLAAAKATPPPPPPPMPPAFMNPVEPNPVPANSDLLAQIRQGSTLKAASERPESTAPVAASPPSIMDSLADAIAFRRQGISGISPPSPASSDSDDDDDDDAWDDGDTGPAAAEKEAEYRARNSAVEKAVEEEEQARKKAAEDERLRQKKLVEDEQARKKAADDERLRQKKATEDERARREKESDDRRRADAAEEERRLRREKEDVESERRRLDIAEEEAENARRSAELKARKDEDTKRRTAKAALDKEEADQKKAQEKEDRAAAKAQKKKDDAEMKKKAHQALVDAQKRREAMDLQRLKDDEDARRAKEQALRLSDTAPPALPARSGSVSREDVILKPESDEVTGRSTNRILPASFFTSLQTAGITREDVITVDDFLTTVARWRTDIKALKRVGPKQPRTLVRNKKTKQYELMPFDQYYARNNKFKESVAAFKARNTAWEASDSTAEDADARRRAQSEVMYQVFEAGFTRTKKPQDWNTAFALVMPNPTMPQLRDFYDFCFFAYMLTNSVSFGRIRKSFGGAHWSPHVYGVTPEIRDTMEQYHDDWQALRSLHTYEHSEHFLASAAPAPAPKPDPIPVCRTKTFSGKLEPTNTRFGERSADRIYSDLRANATRVNIRGARPGHGKHMALLAEHLPVALEGDRYQVLAVRDDQIERMGRLLAKKDAMRTFLHQQLLDRKASADNGQWINAQGYQVKPAGLVHPVPSGVSLGDREPFLVRLPFLH